MWGRKAGHEIIEIHSGTTGDSGDDFQCLSVSCNVYRVSGLCLGAQPLCLSDLRSLSLVGSAASMGLS